MTNTNSSDSEWIGGKQAYSRQTDTSNDDWLSEFSDEDLGFNINPVGWKPGCRTIEDEQEEE